jgi:hypothetical protein
MSGIVKFETCNAIGNTILRFHQLIFEAASFCPTCHEDVINICHNDLHQPLDVPSEKWLENSSPV